MIGNKTNTRKDGITSESTVNCQIYLAINQARTRQQQQQQHDTNNKNKSENRMIYSGASLSYRRHLSPNRLELRAKLTITLNLICRRADVPSQQIHTRSVSLSLSTNSHLYNAAKKMWQHANEVPKCISRIRHVKCAIQFLI